jgi:hypothetical protein
METKKYFYEKNEWLMNPETNLTYLEQDSIDILTELGCEYRGKIRMTMSPMTGIDMSGVKNSMKINGTAYKYEPIFTFYKP